MCKSVIFAGGFKGIILFIILKQKRIINKFISANN